MVLSRSKKAPTRVEASPREGAGAALPAVVAFSFWGFIRVEF